MFELIAVINIALASFMIGNDYDAIVAYQNGLNAPDDSGYVFIEEQDEDGVRDLES